ESGRIGLTANEFTWETGSEGSNPSLSAPLWASTGNRTETAIESGAMAAELSRTVVVGGRSSVGTQGHRSVVPHAPGLVHVRSSAVLASLVAGGCTGPRGMSTRPVSFGSALFRWWPGRLELG